MFKINTGLYFLSAVGKFLELLKCNLLQNDSEVPSGLLLHILDLYMTELAAVGAAEVQHHHWSLHVENLALISQRENAS